MSVSSLDLPLVDSSVRGRTWKLSSAADRQEPPCALLSMQILYSNDTKVSEDSVSECALLSCAGAQNAHKLRWEEHSKVIPFL